MTRVMLPGKLGPEAPSLPAPASPEVLGPLSPPGLFNPVSLPYRVFLEILGFAIHHIFQQYRPGLRGADCKWDPLCSKFQILGTYAPRRKWGMVSRGCCVHRTDDVLLSSGGPISISVVTG